MIEKKVFRQKILNLININAINGQKIKIDNAKTIICQKSKVLTFNDMQPTNQHDQ